MIAHFVSSVLVPWFCISVEVFLIVVDFCWDLSSEGVSSSSTGYIVYWTFGSFVLKLFRDVNVTCVIPLPPEDLLVIIRSRLYLSDSTACPVGPVFLSVVNKIDYLNEKIDGDGTLSSKIVGGTLPAHSVHWEYKESERKSFFTESLRFEINAGRQF